MAGGQEVCRFFLQGRCKFGDKCRNLHPGWRGAGSGGYDGQRQHYQAGTGRNWDQRGGNRFQLLSDESDQWSSGTRGGNYGRGQSFHNQGSRQQQWNNRGQWNDRGQRQQWDNRGQWSDRGQRQQWNQRQQWDNRGQWNDRGQRQQYGGWSGSSSFGSQRGDDGGRYGPGSKSYGGPSSRSYGDSSSTMPSTPAEPITPHDIATVIKQDLAEWRESSQWPFSCYAYEKERKCLPGFVEVSPEELRWEAYQAMSAGDSTAFIQTVQSLGETQLQQWQLYGSITDDDASKLLSASSPHSLFGNQGSDHPNSLFVQTGPGVTSIFGRSEPFFGSSKPSSSQSIFASTSHQPLTRSLQTEQKGLFGLGPLGSGLQMDSQQVQRTGGIAIQTKLPVLAGTTKVVQESSATTGAGAAPSSSALDLEEQLTEEELEAFKADRFVLGQIPEHAPPEVLCWS